MSSEHSTREKSAPPVPPGEDNTARSFVTLPNLITGTRLVGSLGLVAFAIGGSSQAFVGLFLLLVFTDWLDGRLARWLHQRSEWGARLDSFADAAIFAALLLGCLLLKSDRLIAEWVWIAVGVASYGVTTAAGLWKFGRVPAYHTWAAKTSWYTVLVAVVFVFLDWSIWPVRIAAVAVTLTNLEATLITHVLPSWQTDVPSLFHARKIRERPESSESAPDENGSALR